MRPIFILVCIAHIISAPGDPCILYIVYRRQKEAEYRECVSLGCKLERKLHKPTSLLLSTVWNCRRLVVAKQCILHVHQHLSCGLYAKGGIVSWEEEEKGWEEVNTRMDFGFLCTPSHPIQPPASHYPHYHCRSWNTFAKENNFERFKAFDFQMEYFQCMQLISNSWKKYA